MPFTSVGYSGSVGWQDWAQIAASLGTDYCVGDLGDLLVTVADATAGTLTIQPGTAHGRGVTDTLAVAETIAGLTVPSTWYTVVVRRDWTPEPGSEVTTVVPLAGGSARAIAPARQVGVGAIDDQPIFLVHRGATALDEVVDLRCWWGNGAMAAASVDALAYLGRPGSQVRVGATTYERGLGSSSWTPVTVAAGQVASGVLDPARIPNLPASRIITGVLDQLRIPALGASWITSGVLDPARIPVIQIGTATSGTLPVARGGTGAVEPVSARANLGAAAAWPALGSRHFRVRRTIPGSFPAGSFAELLARGGVLPAGLWLINWTALISGSVATGAHLRGTVNSANLTDDETWGVDAIYRPLTVPTPYYHFGGDMTLVLSVQVDTGTGTAPVGSAITGVWMGPL